VSYFRAQLEAVVEAVEVLSPTTYAWFDRESPQLAPRIVRSMTPGTARDYLLYTLQRQLYVDFYCQGFPMPAEEDDFPAFPQGMTPFLRSLSSANAGTGCREGNWEVRTMEENALLARKDGLDVWAWTTDCLIAPEDSFQVGTRIALCLPKEFLNMSPGFYVALGDRELRHDDSHPIVRFYWHLTPDCAASFVESVTTQLNAEDLPFRLKVLRDPSLYTRCDAGVVYTRKRDYRSISRILADVYHEVCRSLEPGIPAFTKPLAPGLGLAEDPGEGQSFGEHRCHLLAEALIATHESGLRSLPERTRVVADRFERAGLDLAAVFLNPGSRDEYDFGVAG
jgi:hypothetical protein